ncbi:dipeptidase [Pontibacter ramchanderi]|uniref:Membrane dipeptidase n=1 Tax=Pontibacter ramchanderi TaxID=1179743 RepID=A0A2N3U8X9_9BACT|nr:dipeptidase [Pontibacter ramchanderi]PKV63196.1 membrane dipeptidase [Pontibacter ramchanderi]
MNFRKLLGGGATLAALLFGTLQASAQDYRQVHEKAIVVDTHNDVLISVLEGLRLEDDLRGKTHSDLARFKEGGVDVQVFSVWSDETYGKGKGFQFANLQIDSLYAIVGRNPDKMMIARTPADIEQAVAQNKIATMIGVEGGHMIEDNLRYLEELHKRGTIYMTLTWNNSTSWATSAMDETSGKLPKKRKPGLTKLGKQVVRKMNELGMLVDLSHVGERTFWDAMATTTKPVLISHSCVHHFNPHFRNLKDDQIKAIAKNGGVIHLNFFSGFLDPDYDKRMNAFRTNHKDEVDALRKEGKNSIEIYDWAKANYPEEAAQLRPPLSLLLDHLDHIVKLVGVDHVGLGSDFDGITSTPQQLDSVADMPVITRELLARGYSEADVKKILGENFLRVLRANVGS